MVTVIIPTYKRADNIEKAINSVLNQTYKDFEIIVVDDNGENTIYREEMIKTMQKYEKNDKVKYLKHKENKNGAAARNTGIKEAKGEYITFLDDDDYFMPERLEVLVKTLEENKEYNGAYTETILVKKGKIISGSKATKSGDLKKDLLLNRLSFGTGSNMFFRAEALKNIGGFDERFLRHQDIECMTRFSRENKIIGVQRLLVIKCQNDRSNEPDFYKYKKIKEVYFQSFEKDISKLDQQEQKLFYIINTEALILNAIKNRRYKQAKEMKEELKKYGAKGISKNTRIKCYKNFINNYIPIISYLEEIIRRIVFGRRVNKETKDFIKKNCV